VSMFFMKRKYLSNTGLSNPKSLSTYYLCDGSMFGFIARRSWGLDGSDSNMMNIIVSMIRSVMTIWMLLATMYLDIPAIYSPLPEPRAGNEWSIY